MVIKNVHCLFEQSGTFKNVFLKLGIPAFDYDIKNDFKQTDFICDLFYEIEQCYSGNSFWIALLIFVGSIFLVVCIAVFVKNLFT